MGFASYQGKIRMTTNSKLLELLDLTEVNKPGLKKLESPSEEWDDLKY